MNCVMERNGRLRIKIYTRSFDLRLYRTAEGLFSTLGYPCIRLTDQSADGYFYTILKDTGCDIAINIDEDAFLISPEAVNDLITEVIEEGYANAGYSDGDSATTRRDPIVTNPFFNIFNLSLIRTKFDRSLIRPQNYEDREPYYPFFFWLASEFKTLYLPCRKHSDGISTVALDSGGRIICLHSWYSRFYSMPSFIVRRLQSNRGNQKDRIDSLIREAYGIRGLTPPMYGPADELAFAWNKILRWSVKVPQRALRWPFKLKRKLNKICQTHSTI